MNDRMIDDRLEERLGAWMRAEAAPAVRAPAVLRDRVGAIPAVTPVGVWARLQSISPLPALAATVVIATVLTVLGLGLVRPFVGTPPAEPATMDELRAAVTSSVDALLQSDGIEGVQVAHIGEHLSGAVWFDSRANGDVAVVQRVDRDVSESGWWLNPADGPPASGRNVLTTVWVLTDSAFSKATFTNGEPDGGWSVTDRDGAPRGALAFGLAILAEQDYPFGLGTADGEVTRAESADGGTTWTLTAPYRDGSAVQQWWIHPDGSLRSWSFELVGVSRPLGVDTPPTTSGSVEYTPLTNPEPIPAPDPDSTPDLDGFDLPEDVPLGPG
ncbi:MAG TPA: hypothetical protein VMM85_04640 [Methylomirabilota bacterium]|nr:hypothetical protein [Methylomirabilota bacterium]